MKELNYIENLNLLYKLILRFLSLPSPSVALSTRITVIISSIDNYIIINGINQHTHPNGVQEYDGQQQRGLMVTSF